MMICRFILFPQIKTQFEPEKECADPQDDYWKTQVCNIALVHVVNGLIDHKANTNQRKIFDFVTHKEEDAQEDRDK